MRRFIIITLTLCMLGFSASAFAAGPGNSRGNSNQASQQRQSGQQVSQQHRQTGQVQRHQAQAQAQRHQAQAQHRQAQAQRHQAQAQRHQTQARHHQAQAHRQQQHRIAQRSRQNMNHNRQLMHHRSMHRAQMRNVSHSMPGNGYHSGPRPVVHSHTQEVTIVPVYSDSSSSISGTISTDVADVTVTVNE